MPLSRSIRSDEWMLFYLLQRHGLEFGMNGMAKPIDTGKRSLFTEKVSDFGALEEHLEENRKFES